MLPEALLLHEHESNLQVKLKLDSFDTLEKSNPVARYSTFVDCDGSFCGYGLDRQLFR